MPARVRVLLLSGHSCSRALLRLLSGLLSGGGFGNRTLLRLLSGLLPSDRFGGGALLGLLSSDGLLSGGDFGGGPLLGLLSSSGLLSGGGVGSRTLLRLLASGSLSRPEDVLPLPPAPSVGQARVLPASPTSAAEFLPLPREQVAEKCSGRTAPAAAPYAARSARGPDARNPVHSEDGRVLVPAGSHWRRAEVPGLPAPTVGEFLWESSALLAVLLAISARPPA